MDLLSVIAASRRRVFDPLTLSPALWVDASDSSTLWDATTGGSLVAADWPVARADDKSGNGRHMTQATSGSRPQRKTAIQNGRDVLRMDGADFLVTPTNPAAWGVSQTVFLACKTGTSDTLFSLFGVANLTAFLYLAQSGNGTAQSAAGAYVNGVAGAWTTRGGYWSAVASSNPIVFVAEVNASTWTGSNFVSFPYSGFNLPCDIYEIIILPYTATTNQRQQVEAYLTSKWGS